ncbi:putative SAP1-member of the AAA- family protein [Rutstroemia sp. NJR-2017a WRK4]|nr:putative SAP1-member of the AAA- family protein [Rutstroemia sp. NJR-2017a WRK4]
MRGKPSSQLQKTYDEVFLTTATAVYFEGQGNEPEALKKWQSALDSIYYHNAYRVPAGYVPKSETEKAIMDSLRSMELQAKERSDILRAIELSRAEQNGGNTPPGESSSGTGKFKSLLKSSRPSSESVNASASGSGTIGDGTIPAVTYDSIPRPTPPPLPKRPSLALRKNSSELATVGDRSVSSSSIPAVSSSSRSPVPTAPSNTLAPSHKMKKSSRSPSPEKTTRTMLQTLRSGDGKRSKSSRSAGQRRQENPVTNQAATLAWQSMMGKDRLGRSQGPEADNSTTTLTDGVRKVSMEQPPPRSSSSQVRYDSTTRSLVPDARAPRKSPIDIFGGRGDLVGATGRSNGYPFPPTDPGQPGAVSGSSLTSPALKDLLQLDSPLIPPSDDSTSAPPPPSHAPVSSFVQLKKAPPPPPPSRSVGKLEPLKYPTYLQEYPETLAKKSRAEELIAQRRKATTKPDSETETVAPANKVLRKPVAANSSSPRKIHTKDDGKRSRGKDGKRTPKDEAAVPDTQDDTSSGEARTRSRRKQKQVEIPVLVDATTPTSEESLDSEADATRTAWDEKVKHLLKNLPKGVDEGAAKQILNEIVVQGDEVHWDDVAGLEIAKNALKEAVVYPFLRPDLFMGLREPARGMLLFGPPGTGKTMLARAVATESRSTFFSISASSLTSKFLGESEKLVRALFMLAKALAPSIIFVDEIDSLLSARSGSGEHEATRRIKTEFLIQWSDLQRAAAGREQTDKEKERGDASRVLVLAATNLPWAIDEAARRRFVRRQYIPLPEDDTRGKQLKTLLGHQKHSLDEEDIDNLVRLTDGMLLLILIMNPIVDIYQGFSGSDITALAKDAAMGPLRSLGEKLLEMSMDDIRPIQMEDFEASLVNIRPSVSKQGLQEFEDWAKEFGERGG